MFAQLGFALAGKIIGFFVKWIMLPAIAVWLFTYGYETAATTAISLWGVYVFYRLIMIPVRWTARGARRKAAEKANEIMQASLKAWSAARGSVINPSRLKVLVLVAEERGAIFPSVLHIMIDRGGNRVGPDTGISKVGPAEDTSTTNYHYQHEPCWYAARQGSANWKGDRKQSTLWQIPAREGQAFEHGTQKPVECMKRPIENNSSPGQVIYEPFCGSGTTIIAAEMTGRLVHAIEIDPAYADVAIKRWQDFTGKIALLEADGRSFEAVAAQRRPGGGKH